MTIKPYTKQELASMYFPNADQATARIHLWRWITRCQPLNDALYSTHLSKWTKTYTPSTSGADSETPRRARERILTLHSSALLFRNVKSKF